METRRGAVKGGLISGEPRGKRECRENTLHAPVVGRHFAREGEGYEVGDPDYGEDDGEEG